MISHSVPHILFLLRDSIPSGQNTWHPDFSGRAPADSERGVTSLRQSPPLVTSHDRSFRDRRLLCSVTHYPPPFLLRMHGSPSFICIPTLPPFERHCRVAPHIVVELLGSISLAPDCHPIGRTSICGSVVNLGHQSRTRWQTR